MRPIDNEKLKNALKDSKAVIESLNHYNCDDEELEKIQKFHKLTQLEKDIMYLSCIMSVVEVAELYGCSRQYIYKVLRQAKEKL